MKFFKTGLYFCLLMTMVTSCISSTEEENSDRQLDSLATASQKKITRMREKGDSIENANTARPDTIDLHK